MLEVKRILVPTDLSPSASAAFHVARDVAAHFSAEIHVLYVRTESSWIPGLYKLLGEPSGDDPAYRQRIQDQLDDYLEGYQPSVAVQREGTRAATEILTYAAASGSDLIVMGTHGHRSLEHPALGGTAGDVVREATAPVLTVRIREKENDAFAGFRRIIAAVDFGEHANEIVRAAKALARRSDAILALMFVAEEHNVPIFSDTGMMSMSTLKVDDEIVSHAHAALRQLDSDSGPVLPGTTYEIRKGNPPREIIDFAGSSSRDLIVIGRRGHSVHEGLLIGTVTEHVVRRSRCPVLTIGVASPA